MSTILEALIAERNRYDAAITALQEGSNTPSRRGRPPKIAAPALPRAAAVLEEEVEKVSKRRPRTAAQKAAQAEKMIAYHAKRKRAAKKAAKTKTAAKASKKAAPVTAKRRGRPVGSKNAPKQDIPKPEPILEPIEAAA